MKVLNDNGYHAQVMDLFGDADLINKLKDDVELSKVTIVVT